MDKETKDKKPVNIFAVPFDDEKKQRYYDWFAPNWILAYGTLEAKNQYNETFEEWFKTVYN